MSASEISLAEVLKGRSDSYRMLSRLFLKPLTEEDIETLAAQNMTVTAEALGGEGLLAEGFNDMGRFLAKRNTGTRQKLATDYTMCFDGVSTVGELVAVPYASVFIGELAELYQKPRAEVFKLFREEGMSLKSGVNLPEDHISFELEFLAILSDRAATALADGDKAAAVRDLELSRDFINEHILTWYGLLAERAAQLLQTRFYRGLLKATQGYLDLDQETIADLLAELA
ncbi:MAG: molecular chaperone TorD family protein [Coriobacteriales bacterium]|nr:molecular chaperone TorD family protein [Coriobacteriales bacterium]